MKTCPYCSKIINDNSAFCDGCGIRQPVSQPTYQNSQTNNAAARVETGSNLMQSDNVQNNKKSGCAQKTATVLLGICIFFIAAVFLDGGFGNILDDIQGDMSNILGSETSESDEVVEANNVISDEFYINCAKTAISNNLNSPSTAIWYDEKVVEHDDYGRVLVTMVVEAQNKFGGYQKAYYAVVIYSCDPVERTFVYNRLNGVQASESIEFFDFAIEAAKDFSDWGLPLEDNTESE